MDMKTPWRVEESYLNNDASLLLNSSGEVIIILRTEFANHIAACVNACAFMLPGPWHVEDCNAGRSVCNVNGERIVHGDNPIRLQQICNEHNALVGINPEAVPKLVEAAKILVDGIDGANSADFWENNGWEEVASMMREALARKEEGK